ncbi:DUF6376 family protein [Ornithinibacillus contaminans]|uniref:DUF6376 family protein n=1 Tax=Ornithinibacillus contaminans TaxID=694055 RepID=UPI00069CD1A9|nr:DUF6376 family protein [Ornithinibacillus contaminans]
MKKIIYIMMLIAILVLSGCSFLEETENTINYATETTEYLNTLSTFAEETSTLVNEGATSIEDIEGRLTELELTIEEFNTIEVPALADSLHQDIVTQNEKLLDTINSIQENGDVALDELRNTNLYQTIESITNFKNQIEQLGFE